MRFNLSSLLNRSKRYSNPRLPHDSLQLNYYSLLTIISTSSPGGEVHLSAQYPAYPIPHPIMKQMTTPQKVNPPIKTLQWYTDGMTKVMVKFILTDKQPVLPVLKISILSKEKMKKPQIRAWDSTL